jgi:peroxiredoxin Q/BCP
MAQLRQDYEQFTALNAEILVVCPEDAATVAAQWQRERYPFVGLADPRHTVADIYRQEVNLFKMGRMPTLAVIDRAGRVIHEHHGSSMSDIPRNETVLARLAAL